jgi:integrase
MRTIGRLTHNKIKNVKPADGKTALLCDGGGLWLQVSTGKAGQVNKSWLFRYAAAGTKISRTGREYRRERIMGLGPLHTVSLADAREKAREARLVLLAGKDPLDEKNAQAASVRAGQATRRTFEQVAADYLAKFENGWKNAEHRRQWRITLADYMLPILGKLDIEGIDTEAVLRVLEPICTTIPETASRVRGRIESILDFAGRNPNPARWKGHLEYRLAKRNKARTVEHLAAMPYSEIAAFMTELRTVNSIHALALELTILTACRRGEVLGARWSEIDLAKRVWTIPASRTKRDKEHTVPLSDASVAVLERMAAIRDDDDRVFPISAPAMLLVLKELRTGVTVHGFRSTFRSWAGGCTTHPRDVCEAALGHATGNAVEQAYMRDALLAKRRVLMSDWAEFCANTGSVVPLRIPA